MVLVGDLFYIFGGKTGKLKKAMKYGNLILMKGYMNVFMKLFQNNLLKRNYKIYLRKIKEMLNKNQKDKNKKNDKSSLDKKTNKKTEKLKKQKRRKKAKKQVIKIDKIKILKDNIQHKYYTGQMI